MVLDLPSTFLIDAHARPCLDLVADNINLVRILTDQVLHNRANDRRHATRYNDGRDVVRQRPLQVLVEVRVQLDILHKVLDALRERRLDGVHHLAESFPAYRLDPTPTDRVFSDIPESDFAVEHIAIALLALLRAEA